MEGRQRSKDTQTPSIKQHREKDLESGTPYTESLVHRAKQKDRSPGRGEGPVTDQMT